MTKTKLRTRLIVVLLAVALAATALSIGLTLGLNNSNVAEAAKDANFNQLANGSTYQYTTSTGAKTTVTVNVNAAHGTSTNPYVISNATQWESFASYVNTGKTSASTFAVLGASIDFGNANVTPAGVNGYSFNGYFLGRGCTISNAKMKNVAVTFGVSENNVGIPNPTRNVSGLFALVRGAYFADICLKNVQVTANNTNFSAGGLVAVAAETYSGSTVTIRRTTLVNISNSTNYTLNVASTGSNAANGQAHIGGIVGLTTEGMDVLRCAYRGNIRVTDTGTTHVGCAIGGLVGHWNKNVLFNFDGCYVECDVRFNGYCVGAGPISGGSWGPQYEGSVSISNCVLYFHMNESSSMEHHAYLGLVGCTEKTSFVVKNSYIDQNIPLWYTYTTNTTSYTNVIITQKVFGTASPANTVTTAATTGLSVTSYSSAASTNLRNQAKTAVNSGSIPGLTVNGTGGIGISGEAGGAYGIFYELGGSDVTWGQAATAPTYATVNINAQNLPCLSTSNAPTRPGFTFKGWAYTKNANATLINSAGTGAIPASQSGNITFYALWTLNAGTATDTSTAKTVTYENNAAISATVSVPYSTGATPSVVVSNYKWSKLNASGGYDNVNTTTGTHAQTVSTVSSNLSISFTLPTVAQSGTYRLSWTISSATSGDITPARTDTLDIVLTVNKFAVAAPTVNVDNLVYNGGTDVVAVTPSAAMNVQMPGTTSARATVTKGSSKVAGAFTATIALSDSANYKWADNKAASYTVGYTVQKASVSMPVLTDDLVYVDELQDGSYVGKEQTAKITYSTTLVDKVASGVFAATDAGSYVAKYALKDTDNYKWATMPSSGTESGEHAVTWKIAKQPVAVPTLETLSVPYKAVEQTVSANITNARASLVIGTNKGTNAGSYSAQFNLVSANYCWIGVTDAAKESATYEIAWTIEKSDISFARAPRQNTAAQAFAAGRLLSEFKFDTESGTDFIDGKVVNPQNASAEITGTWAWKTPTHELVKTDTSYTVVFTPTDSTNYNTGETEVTVSVHQLKVTVTAYRKPAKGSTAVTVIGAPVVYEVKYNTNFVFETAITQELEPANHLGYTKHYYTTYSGGQFQNEYRDASNAPLTQISGIKADQTVHVRYVANTDTPYTIYYISQAADESVPSPAQIAAAESTGNLDSWGVVAVRMTGTTDTSVTASTTGRVPDGFSLVSHGNSIKGERSDFKNKNIEGDGSTKLYVYLQRKTVTVALGNVQSATLPDGWKSTQRFPFGYQFTLPIPSRDGYDFDGWYTKNNFDPDTLVADGALITVGSTQLNFFARWKAYTYNIEYDVNDYDWENWESWAPGHSVIPFEGESVQEYSIESFTGSKTILLHRLEAVGYRFVGWHYKQILEAGDVPFMALSRQIAEAAVAYNGGEEFPDNIMLYAVWAPDNYTVVFDPNGGSPVTPASKSLTNFSTWGSLPTPTRPGYEFAGWFLEQSGGHDEITSDTPVLLYEEKTVNLYAYWTEKSFGFSLSFSLPTLTNTNADVCSYTLNIYKVTADGTEILVRPTDKVQYNDKLRFALTLSDGYQLNTFRIAGIARSLNSDFVVGSAYTNDTIKIEVGVGLAALGIEYDFSQIIVEGALDSEGNQVMASGFSVKAGQRVNFKTQFNLNEGFNLPNDAHMEKQGYQFNSWIAYDAVTGARIREFVAINTEPGNQLSRSVRMVSVWTPLPQTVETYNNLDYNPASPDTDRIASRTNNEAWNNGFSTRTGSVITITNPTLNSNFTFIGWATTPTGAVEYFGTPNEYDGDVLKTQGSCSYTVKAGENKLFARWQLASVNYLDMSVSNNNTIYNPGKSMITVTAKPNGNGNTTYDPDKLGDTTMTLKYVWYKLPGDYLNENVWTELARADDQDDNVNIYTYNGEEDCVWTRTVRHVTFVDANNVSKDLVFTTYTPGDKAKLVRDLKTVTVQKGNTIEDTYDTFSITRAAQSGAYLAIVTITGGIQTEESTEGQGVINVTMQKAEFTAAQLKQDLNKTYNPDILQGLAVSLIDTAAAQGIVWSDDGKFIRLPDNYDGTRSTLSISYTFYKGDSVDESDRIDQNQIKDVGLYTVVASFKFENDKGNYNKPADVTALMKVNPKAITNYNYKLQEFYCAEDEAEADWHDVEGNVFTATYTGNQFRIVVSSPDIFARDNGYVAFVISNDVESAYRQIAENVGNYSARVSDLVKTELCVPEWLVDVEDATATVDRSENYSLGAGATTTSQAWSITKATHDMSAFQFVDVTETFDNVTPRSIGLTLVDGGAAVENSDLPAGVTVTYTVRFTPFHSGFTSTKVGNAGGIDAGTYVVTAKFNDENAENYEAIPDMTATLVIEKANFEITKEMLGGIDKDENHVYSYNPNSDYFKPVLSNEFKLIQVGSNIEVTTGWYNVSYLYELSLGDNFYIGIENPSLGFKTPGTYRVSAVVNYDHPELHNNYNAIDNLTAEYKIDDGNIKGITLVDDTGIVYTYGMGLPLDDSRFHVNVEYIIGTNGDGTPETTTVSLNARFCLFYKVLADGSHEPFYYFDSVGSYKVLVAYLDESINSSYTFTVGKATLDVSAVEFEAGTSTTYEYEGAGRHFPLIGDGTDNCGVLGVVENEDIHITATYTYVQLNTSGQEMGEYAPMPAAGLKAVGKYRVKATLACEESDKYNDVTTEWTLDVTIKSLDVKKAEIPVVFQYNSGTDEAPVWTTINPTAAVIPFKGASYAFRFAFLGVGEEAGDYIEVAAVRGDTFTNDRPVDAGSYTFYCTSTDARYALTETRDVTITPKEVDLVWEKNGAALGNLVYTGTNQLEGVRAYYLDINGAEVELTGLVVSAYNGTAVSSADTMRMAGSYSLTVNDIADGNYKLRDRSQLVKSVDIAKYTITSTYASIAWEYNNSGTYARLTPDASGRLVLTYKGANYEMKVSFTGLEADGTVSAPLVAADGSDIKNARTDTTSNRPYTLVVASTWVHTNYQFDSSVTQTLVVNPYTVSVNWNYDTPYVYNGAEQSLKPIANGVGSEAGTHLLQATTPGINARPEDNMYHATAALLDEYLENYVIDSETSEFNWRIVPAVLNFDWDTTGSKLVDGIATYTYTGAPLVPHASARAAKEGDSTGAGATIFKNVDGAWVRVDAAITAGSYRVEMSTTSANYTLEGSTTAEILFAIDKATPVIADLQYAEYADANTSYVNNPAGLRNEKLVCNTAAAGYVNGELTFENADGALASAGATNVSWKFVPQDTENYKTVTGSVTITVLAQRVTSIEIEFNSKTATTTYFAGNTFRSTGITVYRVYNSFYTEGAEGYGLRLAVENMADEIEMTITTAGNILAKGYVVSDDDVDRGYFEINFHSNTDRLDVSHQFDVLKGQVNSVSITNKDVIGSGFFVDNPVNVSGIQLAINYVDGTSSGLALSKATMSCDDTTAVYDEATGTYTFSEPGTKKISYKYAGKTAVLEIVVAPKMDFNILFEGKRIVYTGEILDIGVPVIVNEDGSTSALPAGVTASMTFKGTGVPVNNLRDLGFYIIQVDFFLDKTVNPELSKYNVPKTIEAEFEVTDVTHTLEAVEPEALTVTYSGEAVDYKLISYNVKDLDGSPLNMIDPSEAYLIKTVNGQKVEEIVNVGTYLVTFTITYTIENDERKYTLDKTYTIVVEKFTQEITLTINGWVEGGRPVEPTANNTKGEVQFLYSDSLDGTFAPYSSEVAERLTAGTYFMQAVVLADENGNFDEARSEIVKFTIGKSATSATDINGNDIGGITVPETNNVGIDPDAVLDITALTTEEVGASSIRRHDSLQGYEINLTVNGEKVDLGGQSLIVRILISEEYRDKDNLKVFYIDENGNAEDMGAVRDGDYMQFETTHFSRYIISTPAASNAGLIVALVIGGIVAIGLVVAVVVVFLKKRKE